jgi:hypothetical protein
MLVATYNTIVRNHQAQCGRHPRRNGQHKQGKKSRKPAVATAPPQDIHSALLISLVTCVFALFYIEISTRFCYNEMQAAIPFLEVKKEVKNRGANRND